MEIFTKQNLVGVKTAPDAVSSAHTLVLGAKKAHKEKNVNKKFTGVFRDFAGILFMCFAVM